MICTEPEKSLLENKGGDACKKSIEILQSSNKKSLPNVELGSDNWRRRWDSPAPLQQSAGLLQPGGTQSAGHGLFESHLATLA